MVISFLKKHNFQTENPFQLPSTMKLQDRDVAYAHCSIWSCQQNHSENVSFEVALYLIATTLFYEFLILTASTSVSLRLVDV